MKYLLTMLFLSFFSINFNKVAEINELKAEAETAFRENDFHRSLSLYSILIRQYKIEEEAIRMNLAHSYFKTGQRKNAEGQYLYLIHSKDSKMKSMAYQQLGVIMGMKGKNDKAINYFIESLKTDPFNEKARYNYEMIRKIQESQPEEENTNKADRNNKEKDRKGNAGNDNGSVKKENDIKKEASDKENETYEEGSGNIRKENENGNERKDREPDSNGKNSPDQKADESGDKNKEAKRIRRLAEVNLSEDKARMILEAMRNEEIQYLQQVKRTTQNKNYKNKPDW